MTIILLCSLSSGQAVDIKFNSIGPYNDLVRGAAWGSTGVGNTDNSYIFPPTNPQETTCIYVSNNNPSSSHTFTITFRYSGDPRVTGYISPPSQQSRWKNVFTKTDTVLASSTNNYSFSSPGAAWAQVQISGTSTQTGSPDTADIYLVQSSAGCGTATINATGQVPCPAASTFSGVLSGTIGLVVFAPPAGQYVHVCSYEITGTIAATSASQVYFATNTSGAANCSTVGSADWLFTTSSSVVPHYYLAGGSAQLFQTDTPAEALCFNNPSSGSTLWISISYFIG
jgi:hypothetical protein